VSQQQTLTKLEKAKSLRGIRKRLGWTQPRMAKALGLDFTYLSQLENGKRDLDDWYLQRANEIALEVEKSKNVKGEASREESELRAKCHAYLDETLDACRGDLDQVTWTYVELQRRFPRTQPATRPENPAYRPFNSVSAAEAEESAAASERALEVQEGRGSQPSGGAGEPSGHKSQPSCGTSPESRGKKSPLGPAPK
jgi:transcriptional regulator with XRE-family HTH domain